MKAINVTAKVIPSAQPRLPGVHLRKKGSESDGKEVASESTGDPGTFIGIDRSEKPSPQETAKIKSSFEI